MYPKIREDSRRSDGIAEVFHTYLVSNNVANVDIATSSDSERTEITTDALHIGGSSSSTQENASDGVAFIRCCLERQGFSHDTINIIMNSWRGCTQQKYKSY